MKQITAIGSMLLAIGLYSTSSHASIIKSMTIEEIGDASGGLGTSGLANGGGWGNWFTGDGTYMAPPAFYTSDGTDGALVMGTTQANGAFSSGFNWGGSNHFEFNTLKSAPSGTVTAGSMTLDLSGLVAEFTLGNVAFPSPADPSTLVTSVSMIDATHYFYTADWTHVFNNDVYDLNTLAILPGWNGSGVIMHFEGIATLEDMAMVPEPGTAWLVGVVLLGLLGARHRPLL